MWIGLETSACGTDGVRKSTMYKSLKRWTIGDIFHTKSNLTQKDQEKWLVRIICKGDSNWKKKQKKERKRTYFRARQCHLYIYITYLPTFRVNNNFFLNIIIFYSIKNILNILDLTVILNPWTLVWHARSKSLSLLGLTT
jgi:hypothetical protein